MTGNLQAKNAKTISMTKAKKLSRAKGVTFNDLMLAIISKSLKQYFTHFGDKSEEVTIAMPFSFKTIPLHPKDYVYGNEFVSLTYFLKLMGDLDEACKLIAGEMT